jgi:hypothetical protein
MTFTGVSMLIIVIIASKVVAGNSPISTNNFEAQQLIA